MTLFLIIVLALLVVFKPEKLLDILAFGGLVWFVLWCVVKCHA